MNINYYLISTLHTQLDKQKYIGSSELLFDNLQIDYQFSQLLDKLLFNNGLELSDLSKEFIEYSFVRTKKSFDWILDTSIDTYTKEVFLVGFIHNLKSILDVLKYTNFHDQDFFRAVSEIRNYIIHGYEKKDNYGSNGKSNIIVKIIVYNETINKNGLFELQIYDIDTGKYLYSIIFSINILYKSLLDLFKVIIEF